ncbi:MAG: LLM class flavin-dependent oxidoreductase [Rhodococcus sp. (in: high G+C Gram-positive bacteria)]|nr:MAG: LLM class flavin-dependent oxidoreductase [Rhodococcus sp. (in: high G+C Gram-positive bacteria)]
MQVGFKLMAETYDPREIVRQAVEAERAGFDFVEVSDHYHPWLYSHGHSGFVWSMLAAAAARTSRIGLATGVTCPFVRYHPAIIAQAAATTAVLSEGRHLTLDDARVFDLPDVPPTIAVAAGGTEAVRIAAELGDGLFATEPDPDLVKAYTGAGGTGPRYGEVPLAWSRDEQPAVESAHRLFRFGLTGWKVQAELPNPINFEAAPSAIRTEDVRDAIACGPDVRRHLEVAGTFVDAGFDHLALIDAGPDVDGFFEFFANELNEPLRALTTR